MMTHDEVYHGYRGGDDHDHGVNDDDINGDSGQAMLSVGMTSLERGMTSSPTRPAVDTSSTFSDLCKKCFFIQPGISLQPLQRHTSLKQFYEPQPWGLIFCIHSAILATSCYATICFNFFRNKNLKKRNKSGGKISKIRGPSGV